MTDVLTPNEEPEIKGLPEGLTYLNSFEITQDDYLGFEYPLDDDGKRDMSQNKLPGHPRLPGGIMSIISCMHVYENTRGKIVLVAEVDIDNQDRDFLTSVTIKADNFWQILGKITCLKGAEGLARATGAKKMNFYSISPDAKKMRFIITEKGYKTLTGVGKMIIGSGEMVDEHGSKIADVASMSVNTMTPSIVEGQRQKDKDFSGLDIADDQLPAMNGHNIDTFFETILPKDTEIKVTLGSGEIPDKITAQIPIPTDACYFGFHFPGDLKQNIPADPVELGAAIFKIIEGMMSKYLESKDITGEFGIKSIGEVKFTEQIFPETQYIDVEILVGQNDEGDLVLQTGVKKPSVDGKIYDIINIVYGKIAEHEQSIKDTTKAGIQENLPKDLK